MDILEEPRKLNVSFGTTQNRTLFPVHMAPNRFGNDLKPLRGQPNTGPGCYNNEEVSNFKYQIDTYLTSQKGYTMGARTGPRFRKEFKEVTPAPPEYQTKVTDPIEFTPSYKPFNAAADRFPVYKREIEESVPGAGTYEHEIPRNRKVQWHQSFGGAPINLPAVTIKSTLQPNTEKLLSTKETKKYERRLAYLKLYYK
ncbi:protein pitchfork [Lingula anatina]|uniref:Protein pitchfork n=1 Tax=Lingula anatina TaxID=7574 RepID=A0A1S3JVE1_LINAN|nr:protein pitchfork [Lingula anatina]|eukprot:XP_013414333.1 protein pitchfork [Lingula anatina]